MSKKTSVSSLRRARGMHFSKIELSMPAFVFEAQSDVQKSYFRESEYYKNRVSQGKRSRKSKDEKTKEMSKLEADNGEERWNFNGKRMAQKQNNISKKASKFGKPAKVIRERKSGTKKPVKESGKKKNENGRYYKGVYIKNGNMIYPETPESEIEKRKLNGAKSPSKIQNNKNLKNLLSNSGTKNCLVESEIYDESKVKQVEIANWGKGNSNNSRILGFYIKQQYSS